MSELENFDPTTRFYVDEDDLEITEPEENTVS